MRRKHKSRRPQPPVPVVLPSKSDNAVPRRTTIADLPDDLLLDVFEIVRDFYIFGFREEIRKWLGLRRVCRRWYVTMEQPTLWRVFKAGRSPAQLSFSLSRSASTGRKDIIFTHADALPAQLPLLQPHLASLYRLAFNFNFMYSFSNSFVWMGHLRDFLANTFPTVVEVAILFPPGLGQWNPIPAPRLSFPNHLFPCLRHLRLSAVELPVRSPGLHSLHLENPLANGDNAGTLGEHILDMLRDSPELRTLYLDIYAPDNFVSDNEYRVKLPQLQALWSMSTSIVSVSAFFTVVHMPSISQLSVGRLYCGSRDLTRTALQDFLTAEWRIIQDLKEGTATIDLIPCGPRDISSAHILRAWNARASLTLRFYPPFGDAVHSLSDILPHSFSITALIVFCEIRGPRWGDYSWMTIFSALMQLEVVKLNDTDGVNPRDFTWEWQAEMWMGLDSATRRSVPPNAVCCPRLRYVQTLGTFAPEAGHFGSATYPAMEKALKARAGRGAKLEELLFHNVRRMPDDTPEALKSQWFSEGRRERFMTVVQPEMVERASYQARIVEGVQK